MDLGKKLYQGRVNCFRMTTPLGYTSLAGFTQREEWT